ncbi:MAG: hypothetical protein ABIQ77_12180 [Anaerolineales bacterium]
MTDDKSVDVGKVWWFWFTTSAFDVDKRLRRIFRMTRVVNSVMRRFREWVERSCASCSVSNVR